MNSNSVLWITFGEYIRGIDSNQAVPGWWSVRVEPDKYGHPASICCASFTSKVSGSGLTLFQGAIGVNRSVHHVLIPDLSVLPAVDNQESIRVESSYVSFPLRYGSVVQPEFHYTSDNMLEALTITVKDYCEELY